MKRRTYHSQRLAPLQKTFATAKPTKPYERFRPPKVANTGCDPNGAFLKFIKKDCAEPISVRKEHFQPPIDQEHFKTTQGKWAVGTMKFDKDKVTNEGFIQRDFKPVSRHHIKTDHISVVPPDRDRPFQKVYDKILTKPAYNKNNV